MQDQIWKKTLGPEHPYTATALNNLALLHYRNRDYAQAERLFLRALKIREKTLGFSHPEVIATLENMAQCYRANGDTEQAEKIITNQIEIELLDTGVLSGNNKAWPEIVRFCSGFTIESLKFREMVMF